MIDIQTPRAKGNGTLIKVAGIVGFVAIIGIGMWGSVAIARNTPGVFSSIATALTSVFVPAGEKIVLSLPSSTVNSGDAFVLSWQHEKKSVDGSYTLRYDCADGVSFTSPAASGAATQVFCNVPFNFLNSGDSITLSAYSTATAPTTVTLHIDFTPNGGGKPTVTGSTVLTVTNTSGTTATTPVTTTTTTVTTTPTPRTPGPTTTTVYPLSTGVAPSDPNGHVDLSARIIEQGVVDKNTGIFTASTSPNRFDPTNRIAVRFAVENDGTKTSPPWTFNAVLPTFPPTVFSSPSQQPLNPGDRIEFTIAFDEVADSDTGTFTVNVDPTGAINESNKTNNIVSYTVTSVKPK